MNLLINKTFETMLKCEHSLSLNLKVQRYEVLACTIMVTSHVNGIAPK